ncbi:MAG: hypothetical protein JW801_06195 [Bacteroidales bacterium]|nr:hypothetical protein [Bacteroidales bacterium]
MSKRIDIGSFHESDEPVKTPVKRWFHWFDHQTALFPILGRLHPEFRLILILAIIAILTGIMLFWVLLPGTEEKLIRQSWCIEQMHFNGKKIMTYRERSQQHPDGYCGQHIRFREDGTILLPGINEHRIVAKWKWKNRRLTISPLTPQAVSPLNTSEVKTYFEGNYRVKIKGKDLLLQSDHIIIRARAFEQLWERHEKR